MIDAQVVVVGAGVAGAVLSSELHRAGLDVIVLEKHARLPDKYRGEILQPYGIAVLRRAGMLPALLDAGAVWVHQFDTICMHQQQTVVVEQPVATGSESLVLRHRLLMEALRLPLRSLLGDRLREGYRVNHIERDPDGRYVVTAVDGNRTVAFRSRLLVGADGAQSSIRRALPFQAEEAPPAHALSGVVVRVPPDSFPNFLNIQPLGEGVAGYAFPVGREEVRLGLTTSIEESRAQQRGLEKRVIEFVRAAMGNLNYAIPEAPELVEPLKIEPIFRVRTLSAVMDGVALVGDAAGTVHPHTGYGMTLACNDVIHLAKLLIAEPPDRVVTATALQPFEQRRHRIRRSLERMSDLRVRLILGTSEADLIRAYWLWFSGETPPEPGSPLAALQEELQETHRTLNEEFQAVD